MDDHPCGRGSAHLPPLLKAASAFFATIPMEPSVHLAPSITVAHGELPNSPALIRSVVIDLPDVYASTMSVMQQNWDSVVVSVGEEKHIHLGPCLPVDDGATWSPAERDVPHQHSPRERRNEDAAVPRQSVGQSVGLTGYYEQQVSLAVTHGGGPANLPDFPSWIAPLECDYHESETFFLLEEPVPLPGATTRDYAGRRLPLFKLTPTQAAELGRDPESTVLAAVDVSCPGVVPARKDFVRGALFALIFIEGPPPVVLPDGATRPACGARMTCTTMMDFGGGSPAITRLLPPLVDCWLKECLDPYVIIVRWLQEAYGDKPVPFGDRDAFLLAVKMARDLSRRRGRTPPDHAQVSCGCAIQ